MSYQPEPTSGTSYKFRVGHQLVFAWDISWFVRVSYPMSHYIKLMIIIKISKVSGTCPTKNTPCDYWTFCDANRQMHRNGVALDAWAGASGLERAAFQAEAAQARQTFLIKHATPQQLKQEAAYESQVNREQAQREEADRQHNFVAQQQQGLYAVLPAINANGETMDSKYFRRLSTVDYPLFKQLVRKFGSAQITERLRTPEVVTA